LSGLRLSPTTNPSATFCRDLSPFPFFADDKNGLTPPSRLQRIIHRGLGICRSVPYITDKVPFFTDTFPYIADDKPFITDDKPFFADIAFRQCFVFKR